MMETGPPKTPWFWIDSRVAKQMPEIGVTAFGVYGAMAHFSDRHRTCHPSAKTIAAFCGITIRSVWRAIELLERSGLIAVERGRTANGQPASNVYKLLPQLHSEPNDIQGASVTGGSDTNDLGVVTQTHHGVVTETTHELDPIRTRSNEPDVSCRNLRFDESDMAAAKWMHGLNLELQPDRETPNFERWANDLRLMRERKGWTNEEIRELYQWCHDDVFWRTNVLSPAKLRAKWDDLQLKRRCQGNGAGRPNQTGRHGGGCGSGSPARIRTGGK